jgi:uncharacterized metal-binding protein
LGGVLAVILKEPLVFLAVVAGYYLGLLIDPDWDMPRKNTEAKKRWKKIPLLGRLMNGWIHLYGMTSQSLLGGHRSLLTHTPLVSTLIRVGWVTAPILVIVWVWVGAFPIPGNELAALILGLSLSDTIHFIADLGGS